jgi:transposase
MQTIGFDIAKSVFQVHGVDAAGEVVVRRQLKRRSHDWSRERRLVMACG